MAKARRAQTPRRESAPRRGPGADVLAIDDNAIFLRIAAPALKRLGYRPRLAQSVEAAQAQLLGGAPISVILLDLSWRTTASGSKAWRMP